MNNRVEICGVNTSKLKLLTESEKDELMLRIKEGDPVAYNKFIMGNLRLVLSVTQRFAGRGECMDDLFQVGCIGLIKAVRNFDLGHGVKFSTYAVPMIIGELRRHLRDSSPLRVSRSLRDTAYKALSARERLTASLSREPTIEELANELGLTRAEVVLSLDAIADPVSLYEPVFSESGDSVFVMDQLADPVDKESNWLEELSIRDSIAALPEREKKILALRFFEGRTQVEVAGIVGISQAQVSRLEKNAIESIKNSLL